MKRILFLAISILFLQTGFAQLGISEKIAQAENISVTDGDVLNARNIIVKKTTDNNVIVAFNFKRNNLESIAKKDARYDSVAVTKFDLSGNIIWQKRIKIIGYGMVTDISNANGNGYVLCGNAGANNFITRLDANGGDLGSRTIPNPNNDFFFKRIEETRGGKFVIASVRYGYKTTTLSYWWYFYYANYNHLFNAEYYIGMVDVNGSVLWNNKITYQPVSYSTFWSNFRYMDYENLDPSVKFIFNKVNVGSEERYSITAAHTDTVTNQNTLDIAQYDSTGTLKHVKNIQASQNSYLNSYMQAPNGLIYVDQRYDSTRYYYEYFFNKADKLGENIVSKKDTFISGYSSYYNGYSPISYWDYSSNSTIVTQQNDSSYLFFYTNGSSYDPNTFITKTDKNFHYNWRGDYNSTDVIQGGNLLITQLPDNNILVVTGNGNFSYGKKGIKFYKIRNGANQLVYKVYVDKNSNGIFDGDDYYYYDPQNNTTIESQVEITTNNISTNYPVNYDGTLNKFVDIGTYTSRLVSYEEKLKYFQVYPNQKTSIFNDYDNYDTIVFRLIPKKDIQDLNVTIIPQIPARPGFESTYRIVAKNVGTKTINNISVKFFKDSLQEIENTDITPDVVNNDTLLWNINQLNIYESREFVVTCRNAIPPILNGNDTLRLYAAITPFENDTFIDDNEFLLNQVVVNSFDPNDKLESHGAGITPQQLANRDYLYYTIRFQNTGTASAINVVVKDTLEPNLDWTTFEMVKASHYYTLNISNRRNITWTFNGIYLPDSTTNEPYSHGFITFKIKPATGLNANSTISNRAAIYFDYNLPIFTNIMTTQVIQPRITSVTQKEIKAIKLFPTPTNGVVQLDFDAMKYQNITMKVVDMLGNEMYQEPIRSNIGFNSI